MTATAAKTFNALDQWCLRHILNIHWTEHITNNEVRSITQQPLLFDAVRSRCHWEQRTGGNPKLVGMSENHSVETGVRAKTHFGGQGATPRPNCDYTECSSVMLLLYVGVAELCRV